MKLKNTNLFIWLGEYVSIVVVSLHIIDWYAQCSYMKYIFWEILRYEMNTHFV